MDDLNNKKEGFDSNMKKKNISKKNYLEQIMQEYNEDIKRGLASGNLNDYWIKKHGTPFDGRST
jgi:hypothetical protein